MKKILVIEDQEACWGGYLFALTEERNIPLENVQRARWYTEAEEKLISDKYDVIFLDHRMPYNDPKCTDVSDFDAFSKHFQNIGYGLLPLIKEHQPEALIVGSSSLCKGEIGQYEIPLTTIKKLYLEDEVCKILDSVMPIK